MNVIKNDKIILIKPMDSLQTVGETYEIANILENSVVLRDARTKIAVAAVDLNMLDVFFVKAEEFKGWTPWQSLRDETGVVFYRTNGKKVQVRSVDGVRAESCCCIEDEFNLWKGIQIAYARWNIKMLKALETKHTVVLNDIRQKISESTDIIYKLTK